MLAQERDVERLVQCCMHYLDLVRKAESRVLRSGRDRSQDWSPNQTKIILLFKQLFLS